MQKVVPKTGVHIITIMMLIFLFIPTYAYAQENKIPAWTFNVKDFWVESRISDQEYLDFLTYLFERKIVNQNLFKQEYENMLIALEIKMRDSRVTYSYNIPIYADEKIVYSAIESAFSTWEQMNPMLDYVRVDSEGDITIQFQRHILDDILGHTSLFCYNDCTIHLSLGSFDLRSKWTHVTTDSLRDTMLHEIGHTLGLKHTSDKEHLMFSPLPARYNYTFFYYDIANLDDLLDFDNAVNLDGIIADFHNTDIDYSGHSEKIPSYVNLDHDICDSDLPVVNDHGIFVVDGIGFYENPKGIYYFDNDGVHANLKDYDIFYTYGYNIPLKIQNEVISTGELKTLEEIDAAHKRIETALKGFGLSAEGYFENGMRSQDPNFDNKLVPLIEHYNALIDELDCYVIVSSMHTFKKFEFLN